MERRLGRGLDALLRGGETEVTEGTRPLPIARIRPNPHQPRRVFDSAALEDLRDSIREHGVLQPICVRVSGDDGYEIVSGERRWRAARLAGLTELPAHVLEGIDDDTMLELALVENIQRQDLDPIEKAHGYHEMIERLGLTQEQVAQRVGIKRASVANHLRLLELPDPVREALVGNLITMGHAKALLGLGEPVAMQKVMARAVREELSVRQLERLVQERGERRDGGSATAGVPKPAAWVRDVERRLGDALGTRVRVQNGKGYKGQISIQYHDREELERLIARIAPREEL